MDRINQLYCAYINFPQEKRDIKFLYLEIEIYKLHHDMIETVCPCLMTRCYSTRYLKKSLLNRGIKITDEITVFYSEDKERCINWLTDKRKTLLETYESTFLRLRNSKIESVES